MELNRIHSHLVWLGTSALDLGAISMFWYCFRERDTILDLFEMSSGQRMHTRYFQVGGVIEDIPVGFEQKLRDFCEEMPSRIDQYEALLDRNEIFLQRHQERRHRLARAAARARRHRAAAARRRRALGPAQDRPPTSPTTTSTSRSRSARSATATTATGCACRRCASRCGSSSRRSTGCPRGRSIADDRKFVLPPRDELSTSMEALIHHFKLVTEGFRVPPGELYYPVESPARRARLLRRRRRLGEAGAGPLPRPLLRQPAGVPGHGVGGLIADLIANLAMLDPILGGIDR